MAENAPNLGEAPGPGAERDAIHIAVAPLRAHTLLRAGEHVGVDPDHPGMSHSADPIGVVDPFLKHLVQPGDMFWLFLYPGSAVGLRHVYTHPVLDAAVVRDVKNKILYGDSLEFIENEAARAGLTSAELMEAANNYLDHGEFLNGGNRWKDHEFDDRFWDHYEKVTGRAVPQDDRTSFFRCAC